MRRTVIGATSVVLIIIAAYFIIRPATSQEVETPVESPSSPFSEISQGSYRQLFQLASDNNLFGMDIYKQLRTREGNIFFSPYSISQAFTMLYAGARGETLDEMTDTMHIRHFPADGYRTFNNIIEIKNRMYANDKYRLKIANGLWVQQGFPIREDFTTILREDHDSEPALLDFVNKSEDSRRRINTWVSDKTEGMIQDIMPPGSVSSQTRLVLANTIYFEAKWRTPFFSASTQDRSFHRLDSKTVAVPMMRRLVSGAYTEGANWQAAQLEYIDRHERINRGSVMLVILPRPGKFAEVEQMVDEEFLQSIGDSVRNQSLIVTMPKFSFTSPSIDLRDTLMKLGMRSVFTGDADFSGISEQAFSLSGAFHKASITVDEEGTVAAGATVLATMGGQMTRGEPIEFTADRPFIFLIRDLDTNTVLFMGRVLDPTE